MTLIHFVSHKLTKQTNIMELDFFKNYITYTTHVDRTLRAFTLFLDFLRLSVQKDTIFKTLNSDCLPFTWANRSGKMEGKFRSDKLHPRMVFTICANSSFFTEKWRKEPEYGITNFYVLTFTCSVAPGNFPPERHLLSDRISGNVL